MTTELSEPNCWVTQTLDLPKEVQLTSEKFDEIWNLHPTERGTGIMFGKEVTFPRWQESFGRSYYFTGKNHTSRPIDTHPFLEEILEYVNSQESTTYDQILINWYENGLDYIGLHSDDEKSIDKGSSIYSFSYGQERDFHIRHKTDSSFKLNLSMPDNSVIIMGGDMQKFFKHAVPKRVSKKHPLSRRINITVRSFKN